MIELQLVFIFLICVIATTIGAISGIGGGIIIRPLMDIGTNFGTTTVSFLSGCTVLVMAAVALLKSKNSGLNFERGRGTAIAAGAAIGGILGQTIFEALLIHFADEALVGAIQSAVLICVLLLALVYTARKGKLRTNNVQNRAFCLAAGLILGIISAFLGIGGGPVNLLALSFLFGMPAKTAALHSIYIILFAQAAALLQTLMLGTVPDFAPLMLAVMITAGILGGLIGSHISKKLSDGHVDKLFMCVLLVVCGFGAYNLFLYMYTL